MNQETGWPTIIEGDETGVYVSNEGDAYYYERLKNWDEVNAFIAKVQAAATKAFGPDYSNPVYDE